MKGHRSGAISSYLPPPQYIEFLKYCQKHNLSKNRAIKNAVIAHCNIKNVAGASDNIRERITKELADILKEQKSWNF